MVFSFIDILSLLLWEWEHSTVAVIPPISDALSDIMISIASRRIGGALVLVVGFCYLLVKENQSMYIII